MLCPVDEAGNLTDEAGPFAGLNVLKDANARIIEALESAGALLKQEAYGHRYPYDWRTKNPPSSAPQSSGSRRSKVPSTGPRCHRRRGVDPGLRSQPHRSDGQGAGRLVHLPSTHLGVPIPVFYHRSNGEVLLNADTLSTSNN